MKIVTINVPESYLEVINKLIGVDSLYPSRSELIRVAVREFLIKELKYAKLLQKTNEPELFNNENYVCIPVGKKKKNEDIEHRFKTMKIIQRLD